jgi:hypothetical protein
MSEENVDVARQLIQAFNRRIAGRSSSLLTAASLPPPSRPRQPRPVADAGHATRRAALVYRFGRKATV